MVNADDNEAEKGKECKEEEHEARKACATSTEEQSPSPLSFEESGKKDASSHP
jgi:hypothetical protein